jgi:polyferredoxin
MEIFIFCLLILENMSIRRIIQTLTLAISIIAFIFFVKNKKESILLIWMLSFSFASIIFGKLFCGYFCPFHAFDKAWGYLLNKLKINRIKTPELLKRKYISFPNNMSFSIFHYIQFVLISILWISFLGTNSCNY